MCKACPPEQNGNNHVAALKVVDLGLKWDEEVGGWRLLYLWEERGKWYSLKHGHKYSTLKGAIDKLKGFEAVVVMIIGA